MVVSSSSALGKRYLNVEDQGREFMRWLNEETDALCDTGYSFPVSNLSVDIGAAAEFRRGNQELKLTQLIIEFSANRLSAYKTY